MRQCKCVILGDEESKHLLVFCCFEPEQPGSSPGAFGASVFPQESVLGANTHSSNVWQLLRTMLDSSLSLQSCRTEREQAC